ncbi:MAG: NADH-quinone oxidoreductase subunit C [Cytophagales bacterium]|nr:MAG: NADH-quinone oxidoreductase subunit C [Cytophagales bacterium]TAF62512.1 MAG: NADH-quinone oxidoreductase subunit C [Cytophagales bacterium]
MRPTPIEEFLRQLQSLFGEENIVVSSHKIVVKATVWAELAAHLLSLGYDHLALVSGVDLGETLEINYQLYAYTKDESLAVSIYVSAGHKEVPSVSSVWAAANWHERETYDLLGVKFIAHPDLRRILMPADWEGFPLLKNYVPATHYHNIPTTRPQEE